MRRRALPRWMAPALVATFVTGTGVVSSGIGSGLASARQAPIACFDVADGGGLSLLVDATCSGPTDDLSYTWAWGDGLVSEGGPRAEHDYVCPGGEFEVVLTVRDAFGATDQASRRIPVRDVDRDRDRLVRCLERRQGTTDRLKDRDGDGITDLVESIWWAPRERVFCGRRCSYPDPLVRDLFVEVDRMRSGSGHGHSHRIPSVLVAAMTEEFLRNGVHLHVDQGTYGGGDVVPHDDWFSWNSSKTDHADRFYNSSAGKGFTQARRGIFHYAVVAHAFSGDTQCRIIGLGEAPTGHEKRYGDFLVLFRACLEAAANESAGLLHVFLQELGHNLFGLIEPDYDRFQCPRSGGVDPFHDRYQGYAMWPYLGGGGSTYHPRRWAEDMSDMDRSIHKKLGARYHVNKLFLPGPAPCA